MKLVDFIEILVEKDLDQSRYNYPCAIKAIQLASDLAYLEMMTSTLIIGSREFLKSELFIYSIEA